MAVSVYRLLPTPLGKPAGSAFRGLERGAIAVHLHSDGIVRSLASRTVEVELAPGDTLLLCTDGITRTGKSLASPACWTSLRAIRTCGWDPSSKQWRRAVQQFSCGEPQDDITLVIARSLA